MIIEISICLSDLPKEKITAAKNGKKYINLVLADKKETDQYGNTHTIWVKQSKEERENKDKINYIGNGKSINFDKKAQVENKLEDIKTEIKDFPEENTGDDLPF
jgi:hypothetical protein